MRGPHSGLGHDQSERALRPVKSQLPTRYAWDYRVTQARITVPEQQLAELCRRFQVRSLALFGSVLREDFRPDSDVDVLVEFDSDARIGFLAFSRMQRELADLVGRPVDLVPREGLKPVIRDQVLANAEEIYAA